MQITRDRLLRRSLLTVVYLLGFVGIVASSGGGGGGGDEGFSYVGNRNPADISPQNATELVARVLGDTGAVFDIVVFRDAGITTASYSPNQLGLIRRLSDNLNSSIASAVSSRVAGSGIAARIEIDQTEPCDSGTIELEGDLEDDGTGTLTLTFRSCRFGNDTLNGEARIRIRAVDLALFVITDATYSFDILTSSGPGYRIDITGSIHSQAFIGTNSTRLIANMVTRDEFAGGMTKTQDLVIDRTFDDIFAPSSYTESITGRYFHSVHGYVDISTVVPFNISSANQFIPDSGEYLFVGDLGASIQVIAIPNSVLLVNLDLNADSSFETNAVLTWDDLFTNPSLQDSDNDGMHDDWELANNFNPSDPTDAGLDADNDGFTNFEEYQGGTDPNSGGSTPPTADLAISKTTSVATVGVGENFTYTITVSHTSGIAAGEVVVTDVLPAGLTLVSAASSQGSCTQTATVICDLGSILQSLSATITIEVSPAQQGTIDNTATVSSITPDANLDNNSDMASIAVGTPSNSIQSQIDGANNGDSIMVAPGTYIGTIDFKGKAVTLVSTDGPLVTILNGAGMSEPVVSFTNGEGNDSVIDGFTIRNGPAKGVYVNNASPTIQNNIIAYNSDCAGAGMELRASSAIVRSNIIRDNFKSGCSGGTNGGGILLIAAGSAMIVDNHIIDNTSAEGGGIAMFAAGTPTILGNFIAGNTGGAMSMVNSSNATIINNVIANNTDGDCGGIDWLVPSGDPGPRVINNTFYNNDGSKASAICADGYDVQAEIINNTIVAESGQTAIYCGDFNDLNPPIIESNNVTALTGTLYGGICTDQTGINGNISADPLFVDPDNEDFQLGPTSPSIDAGDNSVTGLPATDILGNNRIVNGDMSGTADIDMGAYEYVP